MPFQGGLNDDIGDYWSKNENKTHEFKRYINTWSRVDNSFILEENEKA